MRGKTFGIALAALILVAAGAGAAAPPAGRSTDVAVDSHGQVWTGGEWDDRLLRLNPATGELVQYLLPRFTNLRRTFLQNTPQGTVFWVGNTHEASIIKLKPLDQVKAR